VPSEVQVGDSMVYLGAAAAKLETSVSNHMTLLDGALSVGALFDIRSGDVVVNSAGGNLYNGTLWEQNDPNAPLFLQARAIAGTCGAYCARTTSLNIEKGGFVRWRELSVTYNLQPSLARRVHARTLSVTTAVRNLKLWADYHGPDPEVSNASGVGVTPGTGTYTNDSDVRGDNGAVPLPRTWSIRVNLGL
jgi:hypothetical protein